jgi:hypothetical protein
VRTINLIRGGFFLSLLGFDIVKYKGFSDE